MQNQHYKMILFHQRCFKIIMFCWCCFCETTLKFAILILLHFCALQLPNNWSFCTRSHFKVIETAIGIIHNTSCFLQCNLAKKNTNCICKNYMFCILSNLNYWKRKQRIPQLIFSGTFALSRIHAINVF